MSSIQELIIINKIEISLGALVGKLTAFELSNFDNGQPPKVETTFKASVAPNETQKGREEERTSRYKRELEILYVEEDLEALFTKIIVIRKGKYKGQLPLKCFNYKKVGHYSSRCLGNEKKEIRKM